MWSLSCSSPCRRLIGGLPDSEPGLCVFFHHSPNLVDASSFQALVPFLHWLSPSLCSSDLVPKRRTVLFMPVLSHSVDPSFQSMLNSFSVPLVPAHVPSVEFPARWKVCLYPGAGAAVCSESSRCCHQVLVAPASVCSMRGPGVVFLFRGLSLSLAVTLGLLSCGAHAAAWLYAPSSLATAYRPWLSLMTSFSTMAILNCDLLRRVSWPALPLLLFVFLLSFVAFPPRT